MEFNIGDKVRIVHNESGGHKIGTVGIIERIDLVSIFPEDILVEGTFLL